MIFSSLATTIRTNERTTLRLCTTFIIIYIYIYIYYIPVTHATHRHASIKNRLLGLSKPRWSKPQRKKRRKNVNTFSSSSSSSINATTEKRTTENEFDGEAWSCSGRSFDLFCRRRFRFVFLADAFLSGKKERFRRNARDAQKYAVVPNDVFTLGRVRPRLGRSVYAREQTVHVRGMESVGSGGGVVECATAVQMDS